MTLSRLDHELTFGQLYPDHVRIIYSYAIPNLPPQTFARIAAGLGFHRDRRFQGLVRQLEIEAYGTTREVQVIARCNRDHVGFTVNLNVLRLLHQEETRDFGDEHSSTGNNWLHRDAFDDSTLAWVRVFLEAQNVEAQIAQLAQDIASRTTPAGLAVQTNIRVNTIELCADFETDQPVAALRRLLPEFKARFCRVRFNSYVEQSSARWTAELWHDANSIRGFLQEGVSFKLYAKTNGRLRLEVEYKQAGLSRLFAPASITDSVAPPVSTDPGEVARLWHFLSYHCLPQMNGLLEAARIAPTDHWSLDRVLSVLSPVFSRSPRAELERFLSALVRDDRVTTQTISYRKLAQLRRAGLLLNANRGVYSATPECRIALRALRFADLLCQRMIARAEQMPPGGAEGEDDSEHQEAAE